MLQVFLIVIFGISHVFSQVDLPPPPIDLAPPPPLLAPPTEPVVPPADSGPQDAGAADFAVDPIPPEILPDLTLDNTSVDSLATLNETDVIANATDVISEESSPVVDANVTVTDVGNQTAELNVSTPVADANATTLEGNDTTLPEIIPPEILNDTIPADPGLNLTVPDIPNEVANVSEPNITDISPDINIGDLDLTPVESANTTGNTTVADVPADINITDAAAPAVPADIPVDLPPPPIDFGLVEELSNVESTANVSDIEPVTGNATTASVNETIPADAAAVDQIDPFAIDALEQSTIDNQTQSNVSEEQTPVDIPALPIVDFPAIDINETIDSTTVDVTGDILSDLAAQNTTPEMVNVTRETTTASMLAVTHTSPKKTVVTATPTTTEARPASRRKQTEPKPAEPGGNQPAPKTRPGYQVFATAAPPVTSAPTISHRASNFGNPQPDQNTTPRPFSPTRTAAPKPGFYDAAYLLSHLDELAPSKSRNVQKLQPSTNEDLFSGQLPTARRFGSLKTQVTTPTPVPTQPKFFNASYLLSNLPGMSPSQVSKGWNKPQIRTKLPKITSAPVSLPSNVVPLRDTQSIFRPEAKQMGKSVWEMTTPSPKPTRPPFRWPEYVFLGTSGPNTGSNIPSMIQSGLPQRPIQQEPRASQISRPSGTTQAPPLNVWGQDMNIKQVALNQIPMEQTNRRNILKEQRQGQRDTRPISLEPPTGVQSVVDYAINPERNVRMLINLQPHTGQGEGMTGNQQTSSGSAPNTFGSVAPNPRHFLSFKPVVYGSQQIPTQQPAEARDIKSRFNKKWYHPEELKGTPPVSRVPPLKLDIVQGDTILTRPGSSTNFKNLFGESALVAPNRQNDLFSRMNSLDPRSDTRSQTQRSNPFTNQQDQRLTQQQLQQQIIDQQQKRQEELLRRQQEEFAQRLLNQQKQEQELLRQQQAELARQQMLEQQRQRQELLLQQQAEQARQQRLNEQAIVDRQQQQNENFIRMQQQRQQEEALRKLQQGRVDRLRGLSVNQNMINQPNTQTQNEQNALRQLLGSSDVRPDPNFDRQPLAYSFKPQVPVSSLEIFQAPAFPRKRWSQRTNSVQQKQEPNVHPETRWKAEVGPRQIHGYIPVLPQTNRPVVTIAPTVPETTTTTAPTYTQAPLTEARPLTTMPPTPTTTTLPTPPPTAIPNPPAIFDVKVKHTFMPMPKIEPTTKGPNTTDNSVAGWAESQNSGQIDERCRGCVFINERCLLPDPVHCSKFIECVRQGSMVRAFSKHCALSSFFDRKSFLCVDPKNADCPTDRCRIQGTKWYPIEGHCKHYWACASREGGKAYAQSQCCPDMGGFVEGEGCVENPNCTDSCESAIMQDPPTDSTCSPMLRLTFDGGNVADTSTNKQHITNEGISVSIEGEAVSNGGGKLILWRYANHMFPIVMAVRFRFLPSPPGPRMQTIFTNCDPKGGLEPSFEISIDTLYHEVIFNVNTLEGPPKRFSVIYQQDKWSQVDLIYDGERIVGAVDRRARNIFAGGSIETRPQPIKIGSCRDKDGFKGLLDDVYVYEDCIPDDMYGIFMSVLE